MKMVGLLIEKLQNEITGLILIYLTINCLKIGEKKMNLIIGNIHKNGFIDLKNNWNKKRKFKYI
jgi:hypothetical protein